MIKSAVHKSDGIEEPPLVSICNIGEEVYVDGIGEGILRYIGGIDGKSGLFCGIELIKPNGKHDGSFQGFSYFQCLPNHGIFAPLYKVRLISPIPSSSSSIPPSKTFLLQQQKLSRSALPSLDLRDLSSSSSHPSISSPSSSQSMQISQSSTTSSILMNQSYVMNGSWQFGDDMMMSNNTYVLPGRYDQYDEDDLMAAQIPDSALNRVLAQHEIDKSLVLAESRVGVENLPVIGSPRHTVRERRDNIEIEVDEVEEEEELITPMIEERPCIGDNDNGSRSITPIQYDYDDRGDEDISPPCSSNDNRCTSSISNSTTNEKNEKEGIKEERISSRTQKKKKKEEVVKKVEERPKKERAPLAPPPVAPKFPVKQKAPSKHQLMMDKLKASMEAEKNGIKERTTKTRVSLLPSIPSKNDDNNSSSSSTMPPPPLPSSSSSSSQLSKVSRMNGMKTPLKQFNQPPPPPSSSSSSIPSSSRKPRVSLLPPPPVKKEEKINGDEDKKKKITVSNGKNTVVKKGTSSSSLASSSTVTQYPTSSFASKSVIVKKEIDGMKRKGMNEKKKKSIDEEDKMNRLKHSNNTIDVLGIIVNRCIREATVYKDKNDKEKNDLQSRLDQLVQRLTETEESKRSELEKLHQSNEKAIASMRDEIVKQVEASDVVHALLMEEEKGRHESQLAELARRHQQACALLDEKNAETERALEELMKEKKTLQNALATDHDTKVQTLSQEISSLNTALQLKSVEMKELRLKNQHLTMRVDEIPAKDLEISKLKHKTTELKLQLDQKIKREKLLVQQNEELLRKEMTSSKLSESYRTQVDVLQFQLGLTNEDVCDRLSDLECKEGGFDQSSYMTPIRMRKGRDGEGGDGDRPYSYTLPSSARLSQSRNSDDSMSRSVIGMYSANRNTAKMSALDHDVIYAPDQVLTSCRQRLSYGEESSDVDDVNVNDNIKGGQADSGIGI